MTPAIFGLSGATLTADERAFFADVDPAGYILFRRNCLDRAQLRALTDSLRAVSGRNDVAILIDQEGGRVARMAPPEWPAFPNGEAFDRLYQLAPISAIEAARTNARAIGTMLNEVGINVDCLPLLDVRVPDTHKAIGDRALGSEPMQVASLGAAVIDGLRSAGVVGVVKHMPGQGRARVDSHYALPVVDVEPDALEQDLHPFRQLRDAPMGMTGHIMFPGVGCRALCDAVADDHRRCHSRAYRLCGAVDERRPRHAGARGIGARPRGRLRRGGVRCRAQLLGADGRDGGDCRAAAGDG